MQILERETFKKVNFAGEMKKKLMKTFCGFTQIREEKFCGEGTFYGKRLRAQGIFKGGRFAGQHVF